MDTIKTTIANLGAIAFTIKDSPVPSLIDQLYIKKPERGGSKIGYRIAALRGSCLRLLGPESEFETTRQRLIDEYHESQAESEARIAAFIEKHKADIEAGKIAPPTERLPKNAESAAAFKAEIEALRATEVTFDGELFPIEVLDNAGYLLSGAEQDALMGLLIKPE